MTEAPPAQARSSASTVAERSGRSVGSYLLMPLLLAAVVLALYLYVSSQELDSIETRTLALSRILTAAREHVLLTVASTVITLLIAIPLGLVLPRPFARRSSPFIIGVLTVLQAVPTIAVLVLLAVVFLVLGFWIAVIGLRSEEHTSELQSRGHLVCRLLLEKKKNSSATGCASSRQG